MELFSISCTTCQTRLKVRSESVIGKILTCPKCNSMVLVEPPPDWPGPDAGPPQPAQPPADRGGGQPPSGGGPPDAPSARLSRSPLESTFDEAAALLSDTPPVIGDPVAPRQTNGSVSDRAAAKAPEGAASKVPAKPAAEEAASPSEGERRARGRPDDAGQPAVQGARQVERADGADEPVLPGADWTSPRVRTLQHLLLLAVAALAGLVLAVALFGFVAYRVSVARLQQPAAGPAQRGAPQEESSAAGQPASAESAAESSNDANDPSDTRNDTRNDTKNDTKAAGPPPRPSSTPDEKPSEPADETRSPGAERQPPDSSPPAASGEGPSRPNMAPSDAPPGLVPRGEPTDRGSDLTPQSLLDSLKDLGKFFDDRPFDAAGAAATGRASLPDDGRTAVRPLPRPEPRHVDVAARLSDPIAAIQFSGTPLTDFVRFISEMSTLSITIDPEALQQANLTPAAPVAVNQTDTTVGRALDAALAPLGLAFVAGEGQLRITGRRAEAPGLRETVYRVADLAEDEPQLSALRQMLLALVEPASWESAGGAGLLQVKDKAFVVRQTDSVHFQTLVFFEKLRVARGLKPRSRYPASLFELTSRTAGAAGKLATPISLNFIKPTRLVRILERIERQAAVHLLVDWQAAAQIGWSPEAEAMLSVHEKRLSDTLDTLLGPMELAYRVVDETTFQVTTPAALAERAELEFYPVADLLAKGLSESDLIHRLQMSLSADQPSGAAAVFRLDGPSQCLLARCPQPQQAAIARLLKQWRGE